MIHVFLVLLCVIFFNCIYLLFIFLISCDFGIY